MSATLEVTLWNVAWATPNSSRGAFFRRHFTDAASDVLAMTEGDADLLPAGGHVITSDADYGYPIQQGRRKALLWSRMPWRDVSVAADSLLPPGRFIAGTTTTPVGEVRCFGVCIPWRDAHVRTGRRDRAPWEDHQEFLEHLTPIVAHRPGNTPSLIVGDFNQRVPRARQPLPAFEALMAMLGSDFELVTAGPIKGTSELTIDHLAVTREFAPYRLDYLARHNEAGAEMSDHFGLRAQLRLRPLGNGAAL
jgi:endonuclease/exonuclease/phosphatase family metal-dependent hydrolase